MVPDWVTARVRATRWERVGGGYTKAAKWCATLPSGEHAFVKAAEGDLGVRMRACGDGCVRARIGSVLATADRRVDGEQLRRPCARGSLERVLAPAVSRRPRSDLRHARRSRPRQAAARFARLKSRPETPWDRLAELGVCSPSWADGAVETLVAAERAFDVSGDDLVHADVWSDNLCFADRGVVLIDWGAAGVGSRWIDVGYALLSILVEGGKRAAVEIPDEASLAAFIAGSVVRDASAPLPAWAETGSTLREEQRGFLVHALRWSAQALGLPQP